MQKITVFGATGMLGKPVVRELVNAGFEVTALVRSPEKARPDLPVEVKFLQGDLQNKQDIERALETAECVYLNLSVKPESTQNDFQSEREGLKTLLEVAKAANVKRIGYLSSIVMRYQGTNNFHWWAFDIKHRAVEMIKQSGIPYAIFYPSSFMENFHGGYRQGNKLMLVGESKFPMYFIAGEDYSKQVAKSFQILTDENRDYDVQGLGAFTGDEAAKVFAENYRREKLKISKTPLFVLKAAALFNRKMAYGAKIIEALNNYEEKFTSEKTWQELGKPTITLAEYARNS
ncbi:MAG: NAD(P)H-binding protein [Acidobacteriota bacterium]|nr:NAD(P)H-binding protein [Acidobacteriota bacterium]